MRPKRIALYSHDTMGLGHIRRNLLIARSLSVMSPEPAILLISGTPESLRFPRPKSADVLALPGYKKLRDGTYVSRSLPISVGELTTMRSVIIKHALDEFRPDILIVDKVPGGARQELLPALDSLKQRGGHAILGLRDILDDPESTKREWDANRSEPILADFFDDIWVYGDPKVFDVRKEYSFSQHLHDRATYMGYLAPTPLCDSDVVDSALCLVGGGQDGFDLARAFSEADFGGAPGVLITGPFMPEDRVKELVGSAQERGDLKVRQFDDVAPHLARAGKVVSMGGYNSVCEILAGRKPALIVPRNKPRLEQSIRAERLAAKGVVSMLSPDQLSADAISEYLNRPLGQSRNADIDLGGCSRLVQDFQRRCSVGS